MTAADRAMGLGLRGIRAVAGLEVIDRVGLRPSAERLLFQLSKGGFRAASTTARAFAATQRLGRPARPRKTGEGKGLFDLTPTDEQQMFVEAMTSVAAEVLRPAAQDADAACAAPDHVLAQGVELGLPGVGVPEELDGSAGERTAVTSVLIAEALGHGDIGLAAALLAPGAVATALGLFGDADQQATYLPAFTGEEPPAAALAMLEPAPLFDPFRPATTARRVGSNGDGAFVLDGVKALVPRAAAAELFLVAATLEDHGPALFVVEGGTAGLGVEAEPAMGIRAAATGRLTLDGVRVPKSALLADGAPGAYAEIVQRARLGWCALAVGGARAVLDYVIPYVNERHAFGEPISHRQAVAFAVSDIAIEYEGMRLATYRAASRADRGDTFAREAAIARRLCAQHGARIGSMGVQLLGGHGYVKEHPVERWYRDLRSTGVMEGALVV